MSKLMLIHHCYYNSSTSYCVEKECNEISACLTKENDYEREAFFYDVVSKNQ